MEENATAFFEQCVSGGGGTDGCDNRFSECFAREDSLCGVRTKTGSRPRDLFYKIM